MNSSPLAHSLTPSGRLPYEVRKRAASGSRRWTTSRSRSSAGSAGSSSTRLPCRAHSRTWIPTAPAWSAARRSAPARASAVRSAQGPAGGGPGLVRGLRGVVEGQFLQRVGRHLLARLLGQHWRRAGARRGAGVTGCDFKIAHYARLYCTSSALVEHCSLAPCTAAGRRLAGRR